MGIKYIDLELPTNYSNDDLQKAIKKNIRTDDFQYSIDLKSLDARNKRRIHWKIRVAVISEIFKDKITETETLNINKTIVPKKAVVVGFGPAGVFASFILLEAGYNVVIIDRGADVDKRSKLINKFETTGEFSEYGNYCYGEGGAGTFSDGKLTSRSKNIRPEKSYIIKKYIEAGAPEEIEYLSHPHIGSNNLIKVAKNIREKLIELGAEIHFETKCIGIISNSGIVESIDTNKGQMDADLFVFAIGHSAFDTYRMLIRAGVQFRTKPFALGCRAEHPQEIINYSQWGIKELKGVKAAEYKLTYKSDYSLPVYSFCMCPGGKVVPASPQEGLSIVNGMSYYNRNLPNANSAIVAGFDYNEYMNREVSALEALDLLEELERKFYNFNSSFVAPASLIRDFGLGRNTGKLPQTSYPLGIKAADFNDLLYPQVINSLRKSFNDFEKKIKGFSEGVMIGLESKTSSTIQAIRDENCRAIGFDNLYICGEGSGWSGGIISSAADGIKAALRV